MHFGIMKSELILGGGGVLSEFLSFWRKLILSQFGWASAFIVLVSIQELSIRVSVNMRLRQYFFCQFLLQAISKQQK